MKLYNKLKVLEKILTCIIIIELINKYEVKEGRICDTGRKNKNFQ